MVLSMLSDVWQVSQRFVLTSSNFMSVLSGAAIEANVDTSKQRKKRGMSKGRKGGAAADMDVDDAQPASATPADALPNVAPPELVSCAKLTFTTPCQIAQQMMLWRKTPNQVCPLPGRTTMCSSCASIPGCHRFLP